MLEDYARFGRSNAVDRKKRFEEIESDIDEKIASATKRQKFLIQENEKFRAEYREAREQAKEKKKHLLELESKLSCDADEDDAYYDSLYQQTISRIKKGQFQEKPLDVEVPFHTTNEENLMDVLEQLKNNIISKML